tara:strand:+ start:10604 stop:10747 length:144 start_codon:yes stop_codon:yes gene_type:complete
MTSWVSLVNPVGNVIFLSLKPLFEKHETEKKIPIEKKRLLNIPRIFS